MAITIMNANSVHVSSSFSFCLARLLFNRIVFFVSLRINKMFWYLSSVLMYHANISRYICMDNIYANINEHYVLRVDYLNAFSDDERWANKSVAWMRFLILISYSLSCNRLLFSVCSHRFSHTTNQILNAMLYNEEGTGGVRIQTQEETVEK